MSVFNSLANSEDSEEEEFSPKVESTSIMDKQRNEQDEDDEDDEEDDDDDDNDEESEKSAESEHEHVDENENVKKGSKKEKITAALPPKASSTKSSVRQKNVPVENAKKKVSSPEILGKDKTEVAKPSDSEMAAIKRVPTNIMVDQALASLNERSGSSLFAIKKYIMANFEQINPNRIGLFVTKYLKKSVEEGKIKQNKRKFKIAVVKVKPRKVKPRKVKPRIPAKVKPTLEGKSAKIEKTTKTATVPSSKITIKAAAITKTATAPKEKEPKKGTKPIEPASSAVAVKSQPPKNVKHSEPPATTTAASKDAQIKPKTKRALHTNKAVEDNIPVKVTKPTTVKPNAKSKEVPTKPMASNEPSTSKQSLRKKPNSRKLLEE